MLFATDTVIWIVRHGLSTFNLEGRCQGCCDDSRLTEAGREQARASAARLSGCGIDRVISSPLQRAWETAQTIRDVMRSSGEYAAFEIDTRLREVELPSWEGRPLREIPHKFPEQFLAWRQDPRSLLMSDESGHSCWPVRDLYARVRQFWRNLLSQGTGKRILLVTHGGTGRALIATALGLHETYFHALQQSNCGISRLRFLADSPAQLELLNDTAHLAPKLPKIKEDRAGVRLLLVPTTDSSPETCAAISQAMAGVNVETVLAACKYAPQYVRSVLPGRCNGSVEHVIDENLSERVRLLVTADSSRKFRQVVLFASPPSLRHVLHDQVGWRREAADALVLDAPGLTALHFVPGNSLPVLQALNAFEPVFAFTGE